MLVDEDHRLKKVMMTGASILAGVPCLLYSPPRSRILDDHIRHRSYYLRVFVLIFWWATLVSSWNSPTKMYSSIQFSRKDWIHTVSRSLPSSILLGNALSGPPAVATQVDARAPYLLSEYFQPGATAPDAGRSFFPTLTPPFTTRATFRYNVGRGAWAFEQLLTFFNVTATIRCNVVQLQQTGGLWVHSPQWPTGEFCQLLDELGAPVEHVVLPCNALEHKAPMKSFLQKYPKAKVWISPGQYGPFGQCGKSLSGKCEMGYKVSGILGDETCEPPWADEFQMATLYVDLPQNAGPVSEVAFCHLPSKTLVVTDAVVFIPRSGVPEIFGTYFDQNMLQDSTFWPRTALQAVFLPLRIDDYGSFPGFDSISNRLIRAPILRAFADGRAPDEVRVWVQKISRWDFDRILASHFASPIAASPRDFAAAYGYLDSNLSDLPPIACRDWELLDGINQVIDDYKLGSPKVFEYELGCLE